MPNAAMNDVNAKLALLKQRFRAKAVEDMNALKKIAEGSRTGRPGSDDLVSAYRLLHKLAGSAGTFGYSRLGNEAGRLERVLKPLVETGSDSSSGSQHPLLTLNDNDCDKLASLADFMVEPDTVDRWVEEKHASWEQARQDELVALIVEPDESRAQQMVDALVLHGYSAQRLAIADDWQARLSGMPSVVVIRDDVFLASSDHFAETFSDLPIVCVGIDDSFERRYELAMAGAEAFFCEPLNIPVVTDHFERLLADHTDGSSGRVLIVDDDSNLLEHYRLVLEAGGIEARLVDDPSQLLQAMSEFQPDMLLMDVHMGEFTGPALARMLRFEPEWLSIPIVYLSSENDRELQLEALAKGGDDFLTKPVTDSFLLRTVRVRCYRARQLTNLVSRDSLTGLLKHSLVKLEIAKEHARCQRLDHASVVAMLDLDHFKKVNDTQGHRYGDMVIKGFANLLRHHLRKTDIIGRYGGEEFIVALPECDIDKALVVLNLVCGDFSKIVFSGSAGEFSVTLSVGVASLQDRRRSEDAIEAADQALYERKRLGRNGVSVAPPV